MRAQRLWPWLIVLAILGPVSSRGEEAVQIPFLGEGEEILADFPLVYSLSSTQWISSEPLKIVARTGVAPEMTLPYLKETPPPLNYPSMALDRNWQGTLVVAVEILEDGTVGRWKVMESSGYKALDESAVRSVLKWRFEPARKRNQPMVSCIQIPIRFVIGERVRDY